MPNSRDNRFAAQNAARQARRAGGFGSEPMNLTTDTRAKAEKMWLALTAGGDIAGAEYLMKTLKTTGDATAEARLANVEGMITKILESTDPS